MKEYDDSLSQIWELMTKNLMTELFLFILCQLNTLANAIDNL